MDQKAIIQSCKELGCCDICCLRYLGLKNPAAYENSRDFVKEYMPDEKSDEWSHCSEDKNTDSAEVPAKRSRREAVCVSCIGVLQEESWPACLDMLKDVLDNKQYECDRFACALAAPVATVLRERAVATVLAERHPSYEPGCVTALKEAWKWAVGGALERRCGLALESGAVAPLLVTLHLGYEHEARELHALGAAGGGRRALAACSARALRAARWLPPPPPAARAAPLSVTTAHAPLYLAGRYVKLSRSLPQTPWVARGERIVPGSVQETICEPLAALYQMEHAEAEHRLKFMSAGREDVDVRCLGTGRPFVVEVADPRRAPTAQELAAACERISAGGAVVVRALVPVPRDRLVELKRGEETKSKTYEALCIKLTEGAVTEGDLQRVRDWRGALVQRTPLRVLHRRALAARHRALHAVAAARVPRHPTLFALRLRTDAGTYVKEWAHGDLRRTAPALSHVLRARADILQLDVTHVHLDWP